MIDGNFITLLEDKMNKSLDNVKKELTTIRTGRATPALVDKIMVDCYGAQTPLKQIANISIPEARMLIIQPWDRTVLGSIEKAVQKSDIGINPINDGKIIRLVIPALTEERRKDLVKVVKKRIEEGKVSIRNIRRDSMEELKSFEKDGSASEDEVKRMQEKVQQSTDKFISNLDKMQDAKEKEILEV